MKTFAACSSVLFLAVSVVLMFLSSQSSASENCDVCVSFNPCAHSAEFIGPYYECLVENLTPAAKVILDKKMKGVPGMSLEEVYILICRTNANAGPMLYSEFLKEMKKEDRTRANEVGQMCNTKLAHL